GAETHRRDNESASQRSAIGAQYRTVVDRYRKHRDDNKRPFKSWRDRDRVRSDRRERYQAEKTHHQQHARKIEPKQVPQRRRNNVRSVDDGGVALGAGKGHEFCGSLRALGCALGSRRAAHNLAVPKTVVSVSREPLPGVLEEEKLVVQLGLDEDPLA